MINNLVLFINGFGKVKMLHRPSPTLGLEIMFSFLGGKSQLLSGIC
jgi:hypothetical protein